MEAALLESRFSALLDASQIVSDPDALSAYDSDLTENAPGRRAREPSARSPTRGFTLCATTRARPSVFTPLKSEALIRLLMCDLVGEEITRQSISTLRGDIHDIEHRLQDAELRAAGLPHREKYLRIATDFMRRLLDLHLDLIDQVERDVSVEPGGSRAELPAS